MNPETQTTGKDPRVAALEQTLRSIYVLFPIVLLIFISLWLFGYQLNFPVLAGLSLAALAAMFFQTFLLKKRWLLDWSNNFGFFFLISPPIVAAVYYTGAMISPLVWLLLFGVLYESMYFGRNKGLAAAAIYIVLLWGLQGLIYFRAIPPVALFPGISSDAELELSVLMLVGYTMMFLASPLTVGLLSGRLRESEQELWSQQKASAMILEASPIIIFYKRRDGKFIQVNRAFADSLKLKEADFIGKTVFDLYPRPTAQSMADDDQEVVNSGQPKLGIVESFETPDGLRWVQTDKVPIRDETGAVSGLIGFAVDITGRKQAEERLSKSEGQLANAARIAHLGPWEYDVLEDRFTFTDAFYALFHTTAAAAGGYTMSSAEYLKRFVHPDDVALVKKEMERVNLSPGPNDSLHIDHRVIMADGSTGYLSVNVFIVKDEQGRTVKTYGVNQDITERKQAEAELQKKLEELEIFYKASMDREDKILELKKKLEGLGKIDG